MSLVNYVCQDTAGEPLPEEYTGKKTSARIARNVSQVIQNACQMRRKVALPTGCTTR
jgi:hypothetical protein